MIIIEESISIKTTPQNLMDFTKNLEENYYIISKDHVSFRNLKGDPITEGSKFEQFEMFAGKKLGGRYKVARVIPNERIEFQATFPRSLIGGRVIFEVKKENDGIILKEKIILGSRAFIIGKHINRFLKMFMTRFYGKLKEHQVKGLNNIKMHLENMN